MRTPSDTNSKPKGIVCDLDLWKAELCFRFDQEGFFHGQAFTAYFARRGDTHWFLWRKVARLNSFYGIVQSLRKEWECESFDSYYCLRLAKNCLTQNDRHEILVTKSPSLYESTSPPLSMFQFAYKLLLPLGGTYTSMGRRYRILTVPPRWCTLPIRSLATSTAIK